MSKLFKELNYDTDRVMQPGDPITSPDGNIKVKANNDGTASIEGTDESIVESCEATLVIPEYPSYSFRARFTNIDPNNSDAHYADCELLEINGPEGSEISPPRTIVIPDAEIPYWGEIGQVLPYTSHLGETRRIPHPGFAEGGFVVNFFVRENNGLTSFCNISSYVPTYGSIDKTLATEDYVDDKIGDIEAAIHTINYGAQS
jgi:hypothetical protein